MFYIHGLFNSVYMKYFVTIILVVIAFAKASSQDITGTWKTIDDDTGEVMSHVEIYKRDGKVYGKVIKVLDKSAPEVPLCVECDGSLKNAPIIGLEIIQGLEKKGTEYKNGTILDPENGKSYTCKLWLAADNKDVLMVRGYVAFFYRTQSWKRL